MKDIKLFHPLMSSIIFNPLNCVNGLILIVEFRSDSNVSSLRIISNHPLFEIELQCLFVGFV